MVREGVVLLGRKGGRTGRNLLGVNLFLEPNGRRGFLLRFVSPNNWLGLPEIFLSPEERSFSVTLEIKLSSSNSLASSNSFSGSSSLFSTNSPSSVRLGIFVSDSIGCSVVDLLLENISFLIECFRILGLTLGDERMEETVVDRAKPGLLGIRPGRPGRLPNSDLRVEDGAVVSVTNSDVVSTGGLPVLSSIVVVWPGVGDMPASAPPDWPVVSAAAVLVTEPGVVRRGGIRGLIVDGPRLILRLSVSSICCPGVVAAVVAGVLTMRGLNENGVLWGGRMLLPWSSLPLGKNRFFLRVGRGGDTPRCVGSDTTFGRKVIPPLLLGVNASSL